MASGNGVALSIYTRKQRETQLWGAVEVTGWKLVVNGFEREAESPLVIAEGAALSAGPDPGFSGEDPAKDVSDSAPVKLTWIWQETLFLQGTCWYIPKIS